MVLGLKGSMVSNSNGDERGRSFPGACLRPHTHKNPPNDYSLVNDQLGEDEIALVVDRIVVLVVDRLVHQWVGADEVEHRVGQGGRIVDAGARPGFRYLGVEHRQPGRVGRGLLLEFSCGKSATKREEKKGKDEER